MVQAAPNMEKLDEYLKDVIQAVYGACASGMNHLKDDEKAVDQALEDCEEVLGAVMEGHVEEWVA